MYYSAHCQDLRLDLFADISLLAYTFNKNLVDQVNFFLVFTNITTSILFKEMQSQLKKYMKQIIITLSRPTLSGRPIEPIF